MAKVPDAFLFFLVSPLDEIVTFERSSVVILFCHTHFFIDPCPPIQLQEVTQELVFLCLIDWIGDWFSWEARRGWNRSPRSRHWPQDKVTLLVLPTTIRTDVWRGAVALCESVRGITFRNALRTWPVPKHVSFSSADKLRAWRSVSSLGWC